MMMMMVIIIGIGMMMIYTYIHTLAIGVASRLGNSGLLRLYRTIPPS